jgi:hypothetical protein
MENIYQEEERYFIAKKDEIKGFYSNLASYVFVNLGLLAPILSSLVLLAIARMGKGGFHIKVFNFMPFLGQDWEEQKIKDDERNKRIKKKQTNKRLNHGTL